jgi:SEC-C motif domain protein
MNTSPTCYCGKEEPFSTCCEPLLKGASDASDPESLMRSRYCAFITKDIDYLYNTLDPQARYDFDRDATQNWSDKAEFVGLEIIRSQFEGNKGLVEFKARYKMIENPEEGVKDFVHHEISKFRKQNGVWYFREGKILPPSA